ncbi:MAG: hypothetical protein RSA95_01455 [Citrobacter sp.]|uniref:Dyp-type peroxidase n=1 Tax=Citrobacter sp. TaxID=1896336 RepID=UPI002FC743EC
MPITDLADIQGLIHHGYVYPKSRHLLFEIGNREAGKRLLKYLSPLVTHAKVSLVEKPASLLNIGITYGGLEALGVNLRFLKWFPPEFREEPDKIAMGDFDSSDPTNWWNGRFKTQQVHLIVHLYAQSPEALDQLTIGVRSAAVGNRELLPTREGRAIDGEWLDNIPGKLHFGYRDGFSQPTVRWDDAPLQKGEVDYRHFILGYATDEIQSAPTVLTSYPDSTRATELVRNGTYSVFRWLYQDVAQFNRFLSAEGLRAFPTLPPKDAEELLAAKHMGRWRDGTPLVISPDVPNAELSSSNNFDYSNDLYGHQCPFSAHIRVTNPRDQALNHRSMVEGGVPRVIRRGTPYGSPLTGTEDDYDERGLVGMFLCASIQRQFYKLTAWMKVNNFSPIFPDLHAQDPLANRRTPDASIQFMIPTEVGNQSVVLKDFVTTKGTAFFLIPSVKTLYALANGQYQ